MGKTSATGSFGIGLQSAKGSFIAADSADLHYLPVLSVDLAPEQQAQTLPPEVGGEMWPKGSFKTGVYGQGGCSLNMRSTGIGWLFHAFAGSATSASLGGGSYRHTFFEPTDKSALPWCTLVKNVADVWHERYGDSRIDTLRLDFPSAGIITAAASFVSLSFTGDSTTVLSETLDSSAVFTTNVGTVTIDSSTTKKVNRVSLDFSNNLTRDERVLGDYYLDDITVMRKTCRITADCFLTNYDWYQAVFNNGSGDIWSPCIYSAAMELEFTTDCGATSATVKVVFPQVDFQAFPVSLNGQDQIRVTLTAEVIVNTAGARPFYFVLTNGETDYDKAS